MTEQISVQEERRYAQFVNGRQTKEERRLKYAYLRLCGLSYKEAYRMMDWTISHINLYLHSNADALKAARASRRAK